MAYTMVYGSGVKPNMVREYVVDSSSDIESIDISQLLPGSTVFVIATSKNYMLNHQQKWQEIKISGQGGGGDTEDIIYDGGDEDNSREIIYSGGDEDG